MNKQANKGMMSPSKGQATSAHCLSSTCSLVSVSFLCLLLLISYPLSLQRSVRFREVSHTPHCLTATRKKRDIHGASVLRHRIVTGPSFVYVCLFLKNYKPDTKRMTREAFLLSPMPRFVSVSCMQRRTSVLQVSFCSERNTRTRKRKEHLMEFVALVK